LETFKENKTPLWLVLYPEGTYVTPAYKIILEESQKYALSRDLKPKDYVLTPKTKGFELIFNTLDNYIDSVYDITCAYPKPYNIKLGSSNPPCITGKK
jgi:hypothetical protein